MMKQARRLQLQVEALECRAVPDGSGFRLDLVAMHEIGHALGLEHISSPGSIMSDGYNGNYDPSSLASDAAVVVDETDGYTSLLELYSAEAVANNTTPWKDNLDPSSNNAVVDVTWSIMPDGALIRRARNIIHSAFNTKIGAGWEMQLSDALSYWAAASQGRLSFISWGDVGKSFDYSGDSQNDIDAGDIRFGAYPMDGEGGKLAQAYFPPPGNGATAPGDIHFDAEERWTLVGGSGSGGGAGGGGVIKPMPSGGSGTGSPPPSTSSTSTSRPVLNTGTGATQSGTTGTIGLASGSLLAPRGSSRAGDGDPAGILIPLSPTAPSRPKRG